MFKPDKFDTVIVQAYDSILDEYVWTVGTATGETRQFGEHFVVKTEMPWVDESEVTVHCEDIYEYSEEKLESLKG